MLPLFPLPNVVLFPNVFLPLHIFEERYRAMVRDAIAGDRIIGMVLLKDAGDAVQDRVPTVYPIGCAGLITHVDQLRDGRYNIVLRGLEKFMILDEDHTKAYRQASTRTLSDAPSSAEALGADRQRLERVLDHRLVSTGSVSGIPSGMAGSDLVNALSQYLDLDPLEKQALLERDGVLERCRALVNLLEMKALLGDGHFPHTTVQ